MHIPVYYPGYNSMNRVYLHKFFIRVYLHKFFIRVYLIFLQVDHEIIEHIKRTQFSHIIIKSCGVCVCVCGYMYIWHAMFG